MGSIPVGVTSTKNTFHSEGVFCAGDPCSLWHSASEENFKIHKINPLAHGFGTFASAAGWGEIPVGVDPVPISDPAQAQRIPKSAKQTRLRMGSEHSDCRWQHECQFASANLASERSGDCSRRRHPVHLNFHTFHSEGVFVFSQGADNTHFACPETTCKAF